MHNKILNILAIRNAKRSIRNYLTYLITLTLIVSFMIAFSSMFFSDDIRKICSMGAMLTIMLGFASLIVVLIILWLMNYMTRFMLEKRSCEIGTYLLMGFNRKQICRLFRRENECIGVIAFLLGIVPGLFFQYLLTKVFYCFFSGDYQIVNCLHIECVLLPMGIYFLALLLSLQRSKRQLQRTQILEFLNMDSKNEIINSRHHKGKLFSMIIALSYLILFVYFLLTGVVNTGNILLFVTGLIICCYLFYIGLAAIISWYIEQKKGIICKKENLFLFRQLSTKLQTMQFTLATLTIFFSVALIGSSIAFMFNDYQSKQLEEKLPFDIILFSDDTEDDFAEEEKAILEENTIYQKLIYNIYTDGTNIFNQCIYSELGQKSNQKVKYNTGNQKDYFDYDTYMKASDYNALRKMLGYEEIKLEPDQYLIHCKKKAVLYMKQFTDSQKLQINEKTLSFIGYFSEGFSQNGQNGADYVIVIPDEIALKMMKYYSLFAADIDGESTEQLYTNLCKINNYTNPKTKEMECAITWGRGSDDFITCTNTTQVKTAQMNEIRFVLTAVAYPAVYIGIVFLCVAMTIMAIQLISDSNSKRYEILKKLGLSTKRINIIIFKQIFIFFACPAAIAIIFSSVIILYISTVFVHCTGISTNTVLYFLYALLTFLSVYTLYFAGTFFEFKKDIIS